MTAAPIRVLLVEDSSSDAMLLRSALDLSSAPPFEVTHVERLSDGIRTLEADPHDVTLLDLGLPDSQGLETLTTLRTRVPATPVVVLTGLADESVGDSAILQGAQDYLMKGQFDPVGLRRAIRYALDRARSDKALRESEEKLQLIINGLTDVVWSVTPGFDELLFINPAGERLSGRPIGDFRDNPMLWQDLVHPDDRALAQDQFLNLPQRGSTDWECRIVRADGAVRWVRTRARVVRDERDQALRIDGIVTDITAQKLIEMERVGHARDLERSHKELEHFTFIAAHDLQEPLRTLSLYAQLLVRKFGRDRELEAKELLAFIMEAVARIRDNLDGLLEFIRVSRQDMQRTRADLNAVVDSLIRSKEAAIGAAGAKVSRDDLPALSVDPPLMRECLSHLLDNALKFRGTAPPKIHVQARRTAGGWKVSVEDNGIGIEGAHCEQIFRLYRRLDPDRFPGRGIGLTLCRKILERHGGRILVESALGKGSAFHLLLPESNPQDAPAGPPTVQ